MPEDIVGIGNALGEALIAEARQKPVGVDLKGITPWGDIARQLDPMMAKDDYDELRKQYYYGNIAPRVRQAGLDPVSTFEEFKKKTEREPLLKGADRLTAPINRGLLALSQEIMKPLATVTGSEDLKEGVKRMEQKAGEMDTILKREGLPAAGPEIAGSLIGSTVPITILAETAGPVAAGIVGRVLQGQKAIKLATQVLRGGATFGFYEALRDQDADTRLVTGLKGAAFGAAFDGGLALWGIRKDARAAALLEKLKKGEVTPTSDVEKAIDAAGMEIAKNEAEVARAEGRELRVHVSNKDIAHIDMSKTQNGAVMNRQVSLRGQTAFDDITKMLDDGWDPTDVNIGQENMELYNNFKAKLRERADGNYTETVIKVPDGQAEQIAAVMNGKGFGAQPVGTDRVAVQSASSLAQFKVKPPASVVQEAIRGLKATLPITPEDEVAIQSAVHNVWTPNIDPAVKQAAREYLGKHLPQFVPPIQEGEKFIKGAVIKGELRPEPLAEQITGTKTFLTPGQIQQALSTKVSALEGLWSPERGENLSKTSVEALVGKVWNPAIPVTDRAMAAKRLREIWPEMLPENFKNLAENVKTALTIPEKLMEEPLTTAQKRAAKRALQRELKPEELGALQDMSGKSRAELLKELEKDFDLEKPPGESDEIAELMAGEINRPGIISGPSAQARGVKRAARGKVFEKQEQIIPSEVLANVDKSRTDTPEVLYHRTHTRNVPSILESGIKDWAEQGTPLSETPNVGTVMDRGTVLVVNPKGLETFPYNEPGYANEREWRIMGGVKPEAIKEIWVNDYPYASAPNEIRNLQIAAAKHNIPVKVQPLGSKGIFSKQEQIGQEFEFRETAPFPPGQQAPVPVVKERPLYYTGVMEEKQIGADTNASTYSSLGGYLKWVKGVADESIPEETWNKPFIAFKKKGVTSLLFPDKGWNKGTLYHEAMHAITGLMGFQPVWKSLLERSAEAGDRKLMSTAIGIAQGLRQAGGYGDYKIEGLLDEVWAWTTTAVRTGDAKTLAKLAAWDTSVKDVLKYVNDVSWSSLHHLPKLEDSILTRRAGRVFWDLQRRTSNLVIPEIERTNFGSSYAFYSPNADKWLFRGDYSYSQPYKHFDSLKDMWDEFLKADASDMAPNASRAFEVQNLKGPFVPTGYEPRGKDLPLPNTPLNPQWQGASWGWQALRGWIRPFFSWTATLDSKLNEFFGVRGEAFPLHNTVKAVDDSYRNGMMWLQKHQQDLYDIMKNANPAKLKDIYEWTTYQPADRAKVAAQLKMTEADMKIGLAYEEWEKKFGDQAGIYGKDYRQVYYPQLRENGFNPNTVKEWSRRYDEKSAGFWDQHIRGEMDFDPKTNNLSQFANFLLDQGLKKKFTSEPIKALDKLVNRQASDGRYILTNGLRGPLNNYINYMKGYPDQTQQALNNVMGRFQQSVSNRIKDINKLLPAEHQLEEWKAPPQQTINRLMLFSYAGGLAGRFGANVRDLMQGLVTGMTVIGPTRYWKAVGKVLSDRAVSWDKANEAGALLSRHNIGELWGDIYQEIDPSTKGFMDKMTRISNTLLQPQRWTDNFNRAVLFTAERDAALDAIRAFRATGDASKLINGTSLWWNDSPVMTRMIDYARQEFKPAPTETLFGKAKPGSVAKKTFEGMTYKDITAATEEEYIGKVADKFANELIDITMWPYRKGGQPALLRTGLGRVFGQYGMYPMNYFDFLRRGASKLADPMTRGKAMKVAGFWAAVNFGAVEGMQALGAEAGQWFWASPGAYTGGPHLQLTQDLMQSLEDSDQGRSARARVLRYPISFIPLNAEMRNIITATSDESGGEGLLSPAVIRVLGMRPYQPKNEDWSEYLTNELGGAPPYRR